MATESRTSVTRRRDTRHFGTQGLLVQDDIALAVHAYLTANKDAQQGIEKAVKERAQHLRTIQTRYWRIFFNILSACLTRRRQTANLEFLDDERMYLDAGLVDMRMLGDSKEETIRQLLEELNAKGPNGCYYLTEWFLHRNQQLQLENALATGGESEENYASKLAETRRRVLERMSELLSGLPGIPLEVSAAMRSGDLDNAILAAGVSLLREPKRRLFLRRRNLWLLREQILAKARARAGNDTSLRLFDLLNEVYARDWRERYDEFTEGPKEDAAQPVPAANDSTITVGNPNIDSLMDEARQIRMCMVLERAMDGEIKPDLVLYNNVPRLSKTSLGDFLPLLRKFDRSLVELPPIIIVPGLGRGFFAWETGCAMVSIRPLVGTDDSVSTAFALQRMLDDRLNHGGNLRRQYERRFPGASFKNDFPADYRAWFTRLAKGDMDAMGPERRAFFRDFIGPDLSKPLLPPNLRNIGPQTLAVITRRLEKQLASGEEDANLNSRLAALYWHQEKMEAASVQFTAAMHLAPDDGEILFAAGMFMRARSENDAANECFRYGAERDPSSLWGVYCKDALANMF
ncbi:MAG: hypothetical protein LIP23_05165 [Planctomycetes bacterium]|nr:hypothetical protein [Planctomycetota bacterium]